MAIESLFVLLIVGLVAGWLAGLIMRGAGFGLVGNIAVGIAGAFVGAFVLDTIGVHMGGGIFRAIIGATIGAVILLFVVGLIKRA